MIRALRRLASLLVVAAAGCVLFAQAQVPRTMKFQGYLATAAGQPVSATLGITFRLYDVASGGVALWEEQHPAVAVANGLYEATLGSIVPITLPFSVPYFLGISVGADAEMAPRQALTGTGYAIRSAIADSVASVPGALIAPGAITPDKLALACSVGDTLRQGASGWQCVPFCTPAAEICDGKDNNCDGTIDEGWLISGKYSRNDACGNCITNCTTIYNKPNASGVCDASGTPSCQMACDAG